MEKGSTEEVASKRYHVEEDGDMPCRLHRTGDTGRSWCFSEDSARRKTCRTLLPTQAAASMQYKMGFHVWGHSPGFSGENARHVVCSTMDPVMGEQSDFDTSVAPPPAGSLFVLGPYKTSDERHVAIKCVTLETLEDTGHAPPESDQSNMLGQILINWNHTSDTAVPTPQMIKHAIDVLRRQGLPELVLLNNVYEEQTQRERERRALAGMCEADAALMRQVRVIARLFWMYAMYLRRWKGPGKPYPVAESMTHTSVTSDNMSPDLKNKVVSHGATGIRLSDPRPGSSRRSNAIPADSINDEGRLDGMETQLQQALRARFDALTERQREAVEAGFRIGHLYRMIDGSGFYTQPETMFDACFGEDFSLAMGNRCVRLTSVGMIGGTLTMAKLLYKTPPTWMLYEGNFEQIE